MAVRVGFGISPRIQNTQVIDSSNAQKRQNRPFRRSEVHGGYTATVQADGVDTHQHPQDGPSSPRAKRASAYIRVSTTSKSKHGGALDQDPAVQEKPLIDLIAQRGWQLHRIYADRASGAKESRPGLDQLMADARRGLFDVVVV